MDHSAWNSYLETIVTYKEICRYFTDSVLSMANVALNYPQYLHVDKLKISHKAKSLTCHMLVVLLDETS